MSSHQVLIDIRPREEKEKDYDSREIVASSVVPKYFTRAKAIKEIGKYPDFNQFYTLSCAAHSGTFSIAGIRQKLKNSPFVKLAAMFMYRLRTNYPNGGMFVHDVGNIGNKLGACLFETLPTPKTEAEANKIIITESMKQEASKFAVNTRFFTITSKNIDDYANIANGMGTFLPLFVWGSEKEWSMEYPEVLDQNLTLESAYIRHLVTILPNSGYTYKGKKYLIIKDSSWFGGRKYRHVSEDWFKSRVVCAIYWLPPTLTDVLDTSIKYTKINTDLWVGCEGNEVVNLQNNLKIMGHFDMKTPSTGYFGGYTRKAVERFQEANSSAILRAIGLSKPTGYFGVKSREQMNKIIDNINNKK